MNGGNCCRSGSSLLLKANQMTGMQMAPTRAHFLQPLLVLALLSPLMLGGCSVPNLSMTRDTPAPLIVAPLRQPVEAVPPDLSLIHI